MIFPRIFHLDFIHNRAVTTVPSQKHNVIKSVLYSQLDEEGPHVLVYSQFLLMKDVKALCGTKRMNSSPCSVINFPTVTT